MRANAVVVVVTMFLVAGCVGGESKTSAPTDTHASPAEATQDTGSIEGQVLTEDQLPVAGAQVALIESQQQTSTDEAGRFVFNALPAGTHKLIVQKLGYTSSARSVDVKVQEVTSVTLTMIAIEVLDEGFFVLTIFDGIVQCSVSFFTPINPCGGVTGADKDSWIFSIDRNYTFMQGVFELVWKPTGPATVGEEMELELCDDLNREYLCTLGGSTSHHYYWASGKSPQVIRVDNKQIPKNINTWLTGAGAAFGAAPLVQQKFTIFMTLCYLEECAEDYSAVPPPA